MLLEPRIEDVRLEEIEQRSRGPIVVAILAYPEMRNSMRHISTVGRLQASMKELHAWVPTRSGDLVPVDRRALTKGFISLEERLRKRLTAGLVALHALDVFEGGAADTWSLAKALRQATLDVSQDARSNHFTRIWMPAMPAVHLAAAWAEQALLGYKSGGTLFDIKLLLTDRALLARLLFEAQRLESRIERCPLIPASEGDLVKVRGWE